MAQLLVTTHNSRYFYQPIASIRNYSEADFEDKMFKYAKELFEHYYVIKFKFPIIWRADITKKYKPDLLLISKKFNKWVIVEVELCKPDLTHTFKQIDCFLDPYFKPEEVLEFIIGQKPQLEQFRDELSNLINNEAPKLLVVFDDYNNVVFDKIRVRYKDLKVCVLEVYRRPNYTFEAYRLGGDYPYDITFTSKLIYYDQEYYELQKPEIVHDIPHGEISVIYNMVPMKAVLYKPKGRSKKYLLQIPDHNFDKKACLQLGIDVNNSLIIQIL